LVKTKWERFGLVLGMVLLSACVTTTPQTKEEIWGQGWVSLPFSLMKSSHCRSGLISYLEENCSDKQLPAVVFLHGCTGLNDHQSAHMDMFAQLGYPVFAPNSFARPGRNCVPSDKMINWRMEEIAIATNKLKQLSWIDENKLILAGHSQGGMAATAYDGNEFTAIVGMGFGCEQWSFQAPDNVAALQIVGKNDRKLPDIDLCSSDGRKKFKSVYVNTGHSVYGDPNTVKTIHNFLNEML